MDLPAVGQKLALIILHGPFAGTYATYVADVDNRGITVARPAVGDKPVVLSVGDSIRVEFAVKGLARLTFTARVLGFSQDQVSLVRLSLPEKDAVERFQQRDFVRLDATLNLIYYVVGPGSNGRVNKSVTRDISGNGAQILCSEPYSPGTRLDIHLEVGDRTIHTVGEVIRQVAQTSAREYWIGVRFIGMEERERDHIVRYIFAEQRERRKRGLL